MLQIEFGVMLNVIAFFRRIAIFRVRTQSDQAVLLGIRLAQQGKAAVLLDRAFDFRDVAHRHGV